MTCVDPHPGLAWTSQRAGAALALQTGIGYALTIAAIRLVPVVADEIGWRWSFLVLVPGPLVGTLATVALRRHPRAAAIAACRA